MAGEAHKVSPQFQQDKLMCDIAVGGSDLPSEFLSIGSMGRWQSIKIQFHSLHGLIGDYKIRYIS